MGRYRLDLDIDYIIKEYRSGRSAQDIADELGVNHKTVRRRLKRAGVKMSGPGNTSVHRWCDLPVQKIVQLYKDGASVLSLAKKFDVSRNVISKRLEDSGVSLRSASEANKIRMQRMTKAERKRLTSAAHRARRGQQEKFSSKVKRAKTVERRGLHISRRERKLRRLLQERGIKTVPQKAIGPYNCDLGALPVAVEVFGGHWHFTGDHLARAEKRFRYILDKGWHILCIVASERHPITPAVANYVVAYIEKARGNPSSVREYRVVRGAGEFLAGGCADDDSISIVPALKSTRDPETGRYISVPE